MYFRTYLGTVRMFDHIQKFRHFYHDCWSDPFFSLDLFIPRSRLWVPSLLLSLLLGLLLIVPDLLYSQKKDRENLKSRTK